MLICDIYALRTYSVVPAEAYRSTKELRMLPISRKGDHSCPDTPITTMRNSCKIFMSPD